MGKTCLLLRYANNSFSPTFITTIGIDFKIKTISVDGKRIKLQVRFRGQPEAPPIHMRTGGPWAAAATLPSHFHAPCH